MHPLAMTINQANHAAGLQREDGDRDLDDSKADVKALTAATTNTGYPSAPKS
jgi:hypothetical protein